MELEQKSNLRARSGAALLNDRADSPSFSESRAVQVPVRIVDILSNYTVTGMLVGFTPGEVAILTDEIMSEDRSVEVQLKSFSFEGQVLYSRPCGIPYETHISIDDMERPGLRRTPRFPVDLPAELMLSDGDPIGMTIRDLSRDGMGLDLPVSLEVGQPVAIASGPAFVFAVVRYCQPATGGRFRAGVEMHHLFEKRQTEPERAPSGVFRGLWEKWSSKRRLNTDTGVVRTAQ